MILLLNIDQQNLQEKERFNFFSMMYASQLALTGTARTGNMNQSCLELEGEEDQLRRFIDWCKTRPDCPAMAHFTMLADHVA